MSTNATAPPPQTDAPPIPFPIFQALLGQTYGVLLAGIFVGCFLFGIVALQIFLYYTKKVKDPLLLRILPAFFLAIEFCHQVCLTVAIYKILINNFGNEGIAVLIIPELFIASFFQGLNAICAQFFYTYRIWKFSGGKLWIVPLITVPLSLTQFGFTYANNGMTLKHMDLEFLPTISYTVYTVHGINVFLDIFFVLGMLILLNKERGGFASTRSMIHRLILLVVNTGLITTVVAALTVIFNAAQPTTFVYAFFNILVSPLYCNSVMANLNSREYVRGNRNHTVSGTEMNSWHGTGPGRSVTAATGSGDSKTFVKGVSISRDVILTHDDQKDYPIGGYKA